MTPLVLKTLQQLQQQRAEPFCAYVYDLDALSQHISAMRSALPAGCELFYAAKANPEAPCYTRYMSMLMVMKQHQGRAQLAA